MKPLKKFCKKFQRPLNKDENGNGAKLGDHSKTGGDVIGLVCEPEYIEGKNPL